MSHTHAGANANSQLVDKPGDGADPALPRPPRGRDRETRSSRPALEHRSPRHLRPRPLRARDEPRLLGRGRRAVSRAATTRAFRRTTRCSSRASRATTERCSPRSSTTRATRRRSPGRTGCSRPTSSAPLARCSSVRSTHRRSSSTAPPASSGRATTTSATRPSPTATAASSGTRPPPRSRRCRPPGTRFVYTGIVASGANLGTWEYEPWDDAQRAEASRLEATLTHVELRRKERARRRREPQRTRRPTRCRSARRRSGGSSSSSSSGTGPMHRMPLWTWRLGEALLVAAPERGVLALPDRAAPTLRGHPAPRPHDDERRRRLPLPPRELYGSGLYQEQQSPYAPGCLEEAIDAAALALAALQPRLARLVRGALLLGGRAGRGCRG